MFILELLQYLFEFLDIFKILTNYSLNFLIKQSVLANILLSVKVFKKLYTVLYAPVKLFCPILRGSPGIRGTICVIKKVGALVNEAKRGWGTLKKGD